MCRLDGSRIQQYRLASILVKGIRVESWLYHDKRIAHVFMVQHMAIEGGFIGGVIEDLKELSLEKRWKFR